MTIYSAHPNRGKTQILATYRGPAGIVSATVTSVDESPRRLSDAVALDCDPVDAALIVDALNRISACATVPVSVSDRRTNARSRYPALHLAALDDRSVRASLLEGEHSFWYEYVKVLLHEALADLDDAMRGLPAPIRTAITVELEQEASGLREALAQWDGRDDRWDTGRERRWRFGAPFVQFEGGLPGLGSEFRRRLDRDEQNITAEQFKRGVDAIRLLTLAVARTSSDNLELDIEQTRLTHNLVGARTTGYFLDVIAPMPDQSLDTSWDVEIFHWENADGDPVLKCSRSAPPAVEELIELLDLSGGQTWQVAAWAKTAVGETLDGTTFVVTERHDG